MEKTEHQTYLLSRAIAATIAALITLLVMLILFAGIAAGVVKLGDWTREKKISLISSLEQYAATTLKNYVPQQIVRQIVYTEDLDIKDLVTAVAEKENFSPQILHALVARESNYRPSAVRRERAWIGRFDPDPEMLNDVEKIDLMASSIGLAQVSWGWWRETCRSAKVATEIADLFNPEKNLRCAVTVLRSIRARLPKGMTEAQKLRATLKAYNGDGPSAEGYADAVLAKMIEINLDEAARRF